MKTEKYAVTGMTCTSCVAHVERSVNKLEGIQTVQVNLLDNMSKPKESNVNMTFYDVNRKEYKYNLIHTLNYQENPDTLLLDDYPTYKVIAHTIPETESKEIKLSTF